MARSSACHRRPKPLPESFSALPVACQRAARLADSRRRRRTQNLRRRYALVQKQFEFLQRTQRPRAGRQFRIEVGFSCDQSQWRLPDVLLLLLRRARRGLLGRRVVGQTRALRLRLLLRRRSLDGEEGQRRRQHHLSSPAHCWDSSTTPSMFAPGQIAIPLFPSVPPLAAPHPKRILQCPCLSCHTNPTKHSTPLFRATNPSRAAPHRRNLSHALPSARPQSRETLRFSAATHAFQSPAPPIRTQKSSNVLQTNPLLINP